MLNLWKTGVLIQCTIVIICIIGGCYVEDLTETVDEPAETVVEPVETVDEPVKIKLLATAPENGGKIPLTDDLRIVFDNSPRTVTVNGKPAIVVDNTAIVKITDLPNVVPDAPKTVVIEWKNPDNSVGGAKTITFIVSKPVENSPRVGDSPREENPPRVGDPPRSDNVRPPPATTVGVNPVPGSRISSNQRFTLTFNQSIAAATANGRAASGSGRHWTVVPVFPPGTVTLNIRWTNRDSSISSKAFGPYSVDDIDDAGNRDNNTPPATTVLVDPAPGSVIRPDQLFTLRFNQEVAAVSVNLKQAAGSGINWTAQPMFPTRAEMRQTLKLIVDASNRVPTHDTAQGRKRRQDLAAGRINLSIWWRNKNGSTGFKTVGPYIVGD